MSEVMDTAGIDRRRSIVNYNWMDSGDEAVWILPEVMSHSMSSDQMKAVHVPVAPMFSSERMIEDLLNTATFCHCGTSRTCLGERKRSTQYYMREQLRITCEL
jgi:hypothetical protein